MHMDYLIVMVFHPVFSLLVGSGAMDFYLVFSLFWVFFKKPYEFLKKIPFCVNIIIPM